MKIVIIILSVIGMAASSLNAKETKKAKCDTFFAQFKPSCTFVGKGAKKIGSGIGKGAKKVGGGLGKGVENVKEFNRKNKTFSETKENIKKAIEK
jgi:hypothetical protein